MAYDYDPTIRAAYRELDTTQDRHPSQHGKRPATDEDRFRYDLAREAALADTLTDPDDE
jgi:hypothetical protein